MPAKQAYAMFFGRPHNRNKTRCTKPCPLIGTAPACSAELAQASVYLNHCRKRNLFNRSLQSRADKPRFRPDRAGVHPGTKKAGKPAFDVFLFC